MARKVSRVLGRHRPFDDGQASLLDDLANASVQGIPLPAPIASDRLTERLDGRLALRFKQAWRDGASHVVFTPHELIEKLNPLIPRPRSHLVRYHGILGPAAKDRDKVVPRRGAVEFARPAPGGETRQIDPNRVPRYGRLLWAILLKRVFLVDVRECPKCAGRLKIHAVVTAPADVRRLLRNLG